MAKITFFFLLSILFTKVIADCKFNIPSGSPILLQSLGDRKLIISNIKENYIFMPEYTEVDAICEPGFTFIENNENRNNYGYYGHTTTIKPSISDQKKYTVLCRNGKILREDVEQKNIKVSCDSYKAALFSTDNVTSCANYGLLYGFSVDNVPIILAEVCYNLVRKKVDFIHIISGLRSPILEEQKHHNIDSVSQFLLDSDRTTLTPNIDPDSPFHENYTITGYSDIATYGLYELISIKNFNKIFKNWIPENEPLTMVALWSSLKLHNWRMFEAALIEQGFSVDLDIYAGTSGLVTYPNTEDDCESTKEFMIKDFNSGEVVPVPLFIWYYIRSRNSTKDVTDVTVVGVNSPFIKNSENNSTILCDDICDTIPWLESLRETRTISSMGYIYCCDGSLGHGLFEGFPNIKANKNQSKIIDLVIRNKIDGMIQE